jgi:hypothetical protein
MRGVMRWPEPRDTLAAISRAWSEIGDLRAGTSITG